MFHCILIPQGLTGSIPFLYVAHIFLIIIQKFQLQIHCTLAVIAENAPFSSKAMLVFFNVFSKQPYPQCHIFIFASGEQIRATLR